MNIKKIIVVLCLLATSFLSNAQKLEKGTWLIGGNLSYLNVRQTVNSGFGGSNSYTSGLFIGSLSAATMVSEEIALGGKISYLNSFLGLSTAVIGPSARLYFNNEKPSKVFLLGDLGFNTNGGQANYNVGLGLANFLNDFISIDITGTYGNTFTADNIPQSSSNGSMSVIALQVGLQIYLPKKK
jgi:hypothetical protein